MRKVIIMVLIPLMVVALVVGGYLMFVIGNKIKLKQSNNVAIEKTKTELSEADKKLNKLEEATFEEDEFIMDLPKITEIVSNLDINNIKRTFLSKNADKDIVFIEFSDNNIPYVFAIIENHSTGDKRIITGTYLYNSNEGKDKYTVNNISENEYEDIIIDNNIKTIQFIDAEGECITENNDYTLNYLKYMLNK